MGKKFTYEYTKNYFKEHGCELLENAYINVGVKMKYICNCGHESTICFSDFRRGVRCKFCQYERVGKSNTLDYQYVKKYFESQGCELLANEYVNARTPMKHKCKCGHISNTSFDNFRKKERTGCSECQVNSRFIGVKYKDVPEGHKRCLDCKIIFDISDPYKFFTKEIGNHDDLCVRCTKCKHKRQKEYYKTNKERIIELSQKYYEIEENKQRRIKNDRVNMTQNAEYNVFNDKISFAEETRKNGDFLEVKCFNCKKWIIPTKREAHKRIYSLNHFAQGECHFYCKNNSCKESCSIFNQRISHKGDKTYETRDVNPLVKKMTLERDEYTCQRCGAFGDDVELRVHHIESYALNRMLANDIDNLIVFCKKCHLLVHKIPGCTYHELRCQL